MEKDRIKLNKGWELHQVGTTETDWLAIRKNAFSGGGYSIGS